VTVEEFDRWLDAYGSAWERHDPAATLACFAEDAVYQWGPFGATVRGHAEIRARSERSRAEQGAVSFGHETLAITSDGRGIARWWASVESADGQTVEDLEGIFLVTLAADGRCTDFREWWNSRTRQA
jgi:ketosteroid isomerase-like protein